MNVQLALDFLASGSHERCNSPYCRKRFPFSDGKFQRVKGLDEEGTATACAQVLSTS